MKIDMKELWTRAKDLMFAVGLSGLLAGAVIGGGALCHQENRDAALCAIQELAAPSIPQHRLITKTEYGPR